MQPQVAVAPNGEIDVVFAQGETIYRTNSVDRGLSFSTPSEIASVPGLKVGMRRGPRIAVTNHRILISAPTADLVCFLSEDHGKSWSQLPPINDSPGSSAEGLHNIAALSDGAFYAVWLDSRSGHPRIEGARLDKNATTWMRNVEIYKSPDLAVCACCHPSVATDKDGQLLVMWRNDVDGRRDLYLKKSADRGDTFLPETRLGERSWAANFCPMDGGSLISTPQTGAITIWRRKGEVYLDKPGQPEVEIGEGEQPVLTRIHETIYCVWQKDGHIVVSRDQGQTQLYTFAGSFASVAPSPDGKEGYLVWESPQESGGVIPQFTILR